jgi:hypothetical protein
MVEYPQDVVGTHALVRQWSFEVKRRSVPDYVSLQQIAMLPQLTENLVHDFVQGLILVDVNVILGFAVDGVKYIWYFGISILGRQPEMGHQGGAGRSPSSNLSPGASGPRKLMKIGSRMRHS